METVVFAQRQRCDEKLRFEAAQLRPRFREARARRDVGVRTEASRQIVRERSVRINDERAPRRVFGAHEGDIKLLISSVSNAYLHRFQTVVQALPSSDVIAFRNDSPELFGRVPEAE